MKSTLFPLPFSRFLLASALGLAITGSCFAQQDAPIKVTSTIHGDGSRTDTQTNPSEGTSESKTYSAAGKLTQRTTYTLDEKGQPKEGIAYSPNGTAVYRFSYIRDTMGRITEEHDFSANGQLVRRLVYRYGTNGQLAGIDGFDAKGNPLPSTGGKPTSKKSSRSNR